MNWADDDQLVRFASALETLAAGQGLSNLRLAGGGHIIVDVSEGTTLLNIAQFEIEAQAVLQARVAILSSRTVLAGLTDKGPLIAASAA